MFPILNGVQDGEEASLESDVTSFGSPVLEGGGRQQGEGKESVSEHSHSKP